MEGSISIVNLQISALGSIGFYMNRISWESMGIRASYIRLVHIVPEAVHVVAALEDTVVEKTAPEFLRILVEEVDPSRVARPAVAIKWHSTSVCTVSHKDVRVVSSWLLLVLKLHTLSIDKVVLGGLDMGIDDDDNTAARSLNLRVHVADLSVCEVFRVKLEVFVACWIVILLGPFNIGPEYINRESIVRELGVSVHEHVSGDWCPFAEMETESVQERHRGEAGDRSQVLVDLLYAATLVAACEHEELNDVGLASESDLHALVILLRSVNINSCLGRVHPQE